MILEKGFTEDMLKKGYWFKASNEHIYVVTLEYKYSKIYGDIMSVKATASEIDTNEIDSDVEFHHIKNGDEVFAFSIFDDWVLEIGIWSKYYFPKFNEDKNQFYHKEDNDECNYIDDLSFILKETYKIAMKISKLKTY